jgi:hypothetical protein
VRPASALGTEGEAHETTVERVLALGAAAALTLLAPAAGAQSPACENRNNNTIDKLLECVTLDGVREHQAAFQAIADANGDTRVSGRPGYDASVEYVADKAAQPDTA